jgi:coenzyme F420-0:L-glutamate ligase/coenzyme F420-1:gamma-L-glutamate ligase
VGDADLFGRRMRVTQVALADEIAAAASLLMGQTDRAQPVVHVRGLQWSKPASPARELVRAKAQDLFR